MNEQSFRDKWISEIPAFRAWGDFVVITISQALKEKGKDLSEFLKVPAKVRLKDTNSLIDKAFHRKKNYDDPYNKIEDKVGTRFVVLLVEDIQEICNIIESNRNWIFDPCKNFDQDRQENPLLFTYQSVHYVLKPRQDLVWDETAIPTTTSCEVQVRTLLQHAHAELTHDAIYKSRKKIESTVLRTVAKSMALIETTDGFFSEVTSMLNRGPLQEHNVIKLLDGFYESFTGLPPQIAKSSLTIWDEFEDMIDANLVDNVQYFIMKNSFLSEVIKNKYSNNTFYKQSTILFVYWMLKKQKTKLMNNWPLSRNILDPLANDLGVSLDI